MSIKACCTDPQNLRATTPRPDLTVRTCIVCGARHFELTVDPGHLGVEMKG